MTRPQARPCLRLQCADSLHCHPAWSLVHPPSSPLPPHPQQAVGSGGRYIGVKSGLPTCWLCDFGQITTPF